MPRKMERSGEILNIKGGGGPNCGRAGQGDRQ